MNEIGARTPFYEFFAGAGMARAGLGLSWTCLFANDIDAKKGASYARNFGADHLKVGDVANLTIANLPDAADLVWCWFICQDVSLAGDRAGLDGGRSSTFWPFWRLMQGLRAEGRRGPDDRDRERHRLDHLAWWAGFRCDLRRARRRGLSLRRGGDRRGALRASVSRAGVYRCHRQRQRHPGRDHRHRPRHRVPSAWPGEGDAPPEGVAGSGSTFRFRRRATRCWSTWSRTNPQAPSRRPVSGILKPRPIV